ncbi:MAG: prolipoprotein diacylglyceryl transferase [Betaproteobacteria bacterium]
MAYVNTLDSVAFHLGAIPIRWSALAYSATLIACAIVVFRLQRRERLLPGGLWVFDLCAYLAIGIIVGARLAEAVLYRPGYFAAHPAAVFALAQGGMSSHGAMLGAAIAAWWFARLRQIDTWLLLDALVVAAPLGFFFARSANFIDGWPAGAVTDVPWAVVFAAVDTLPRHPVQLYQAASEGVLLFILLIAFPYPKYGPGSRTALCCVAYGLIRIAMELYKAPEPGPGIEITGIPNGQLYSLVLIASGIVVAALRWRRPVGQALRKR